MTPPLFAAALAAALFATPLPPGAVVPAPFPPAADPDGSVGTYENVGPVGPPSSFGPVGPPALNGPGPVPVGPIGPPTVAVQPPVSPRPIPVAPAAPLPPGAGHLPAALVPQVAAPSFVRPGGPRRPRSMRSLSFTHIALPEPRVVKVHDIVTVLVDEKAEVAVQSRFDRRRNLTLEANIDEFVRLDPTGRLIASATAQPSIDLGAGVRAQANGGSLDSEAVRYRIAAEVVDVLPNGNVVLEARKSIRNNRDVWEYTLTGTIAAEKIARDMTAISEDIAAVRISKRSTGKVARSTGRAWGVRLLDRLWPF